MYDLNNKKHEKKHCRLFLGNIKRKLKEKLPSIPFNTTNKYSIKKALVAHKITQTIGLPTIPLAEIHKA